MVGVPAYSISGSARLALLQAFSTLACFAASKSRRNRHVASRISASDASHSPRPWRLAQRSLIVAMSWPARISGANSDNSRSATNNSARVSISFLTVSHAWGTRSTSVIPSNHNDRNHCVGRSGKSIRASCDCRPAALAALICGNYTGRSVNLDRPKKELLVLAYLARRQAAIDAE